MIITNKALRIKTSLPIKNIEIKLEINIITKFNRIPIFIIIYLDLSKTNAENNDLKAARER